MATERNNHHLYIGRAGHLAAMAECLSRGWNVAIPEVDVGEDIFVVEDEKSLMTKAQVKTATGVKTKNGFIAQFNVPLKQINDDSDKGSDLRFIFVTRYKKNWQPFIVIKRQELQTKHLIEHIGSISNDCIVLTLYFNYEEGTEKIKSIECGAQKGFSKQNLTDFIEKWESFFPIRITNGNET